MSVERHMSTNWEMKWQDGWSSPDGYGRTPRSDGGVSPANFVSTGAGETIVETHGNPALRLVLSSRPFGPDDLGFNTIETETKGSVYGGCTG